MISFGRESGGAGCAIRLPNSSLRIGSRQGPAAIRGQSMLVRRYSPEVADLDRAPRARSTLTRLIELRLESAKTVRAASMVLIGCSLICACCVSQALELDLNAIVGASWSANLHQPPDR